MNWCCKAKIFGSVFELVSDADITPGDSVQQIAGLDGFLLRPAKLLAFSDICQPEARLRFVVVTMALIAIALDERCRTEIFQARAGTR